MPEPTPSSLDALLEQCILLLEARDEAAVDALLAAHPDAAPALRERLAHLASLGILQAPQPAATIPERLGEFRLLRQIGRGGMGIVYLAEQTALQRNVALKLVHPEQLFFGGARERFRREVLAIARLQHPGIVPILTCGEADGIPFYAMEFVAGASLGEVLVELAGTAPQGLDGPTLRAALQRAMATKRDLTGVVDGPTFQGAWSNVCCRLVLAAARALQHAHDQGVLHRDLKPSNLLVTAAGDVRLIDFGLASARGEQKLTRSGATFGSVPYMAPEQVRGDVAAIDARSDVYALGVTLYELLTLSLPHGDGSGATRERILAGHVEPPSRRNPLVHPDAEAVCLVAMDLDPARRYQSAKAFADDLVAFLEHRTVRARRPSLMLRARRWARRNPAHAATAVVAFVVLPLGSSALAWQQYTAAAREQHVRERAENNFDQALRAVDLMLLRTSEARLVHAPRTASLRRQLLADAVELHEKLIAEGSTRAGDQRAREERARSMWRLGALQADLGDLDKAGALLVAAKDELEQLLPGSTRPDVQRQELANTWSRLAVVYARTDRIAEQEQALRRAIALFDELLARTPGPRLLASAIDSRLSLSIALQRRQQVDEAFAILDELERRFAAPDADLQKIDASERIRLWTDIADSRGVLLARVGDTKGALDSLLEAARRVDTLPAAGADDPPVVAERAGIMERIGLIAHQRREWETAAPYLDRACADYERLAADEPSLVRWPINCARVLSARATNRALLGHPDLAGPDHDRAVAMLDKALAASPSERQLPRSLAIAIAERASWHHSRGQADAAIADFERAEALFEEGLRSEPTDDLTRNNLASALANHTQTLRDRGDLAGARPLMQRALDLCRTCPGDEAQRSLVELLGTASDLSLRAGARQEGLALVDEAMERASTLLSRSPDDAAWLLTTAMTALNRGTAYLNCAQFARAREIWEDTLPILRQAAASTGAGRGMLGIALLRLADVSLRLDAPEDARDWFRRAIEETGIDTRQLGDYPTLADLFERTDLHPLLPADHHDR